MKIAEMKAIGYFLMIWSILSQYPKFPNALLTLELQQMNPQTAFTL